MGTKNGFIKIPILIAIIAGVLVLSGFGYFTTKQYKNYQYEKVEKEKEAKTLMEAQQKALEQAQVEIEKLKTESMETKQSQQALEKTIKIETQKPQSQNISISASELSSYLTGIVQVDCLSSYGSGSLKKFNGNYYVLTNFHVIEDSIKDGRKNCLFLQFPKEKGGKSFSGSLSLGDRKVWNNMTDVALLRIIEVQDLDNLDINISPSILNYKISELPNCTSNVSVGTPVLTLGFPASGTVDLGYATISALIVSNGIVSGYNESSSYPLSGLPYSNYFVSAKIDSGNSGGIAIAKTESKLCILGIPTWLNAGQYDTQGIIQNIQNVIYQN